MIRKVKRNKARNQEGNPYGPLRNQGECHPVHTLKLGCSCPEADAVASQTGGIKPDTQLTLSKYLPKEGREGGWEGKSRVGREGRRGRSEAEKKVLGYERYARYHLVSMELLTF